MEKYSNMKVYPSSGLSSIYSKVDSSKNNSVLDLGEMRAGTFNYLSRLSCKIHFENLRSFIHELASQPSELFSQSLDSFLTAHPNNTQFDVILLWDLPDFLSIDNLVYLFEKLTPYCKPNTLVYMITYNGKQKPVTPARFQINDSGAVEVEIADADKTERPSHTILTLLKRLPNFSVETNLFNHNSIELGMSENILKYVPHLDNKDKLLEKTHYSFIQQGIKGQDTAKPVSEMIPHESPALKDVVRTLKLNKGKKVLELGRGNAKNTNRLLSVASHVYPDNIMSLMNYHASPPRLKFSKTTLLYEDHTLFDVVLAWDIFNYMDIEDLKIVGERLAKNCRKGALIYLIINSNKKRSSTPQDFLIQKNASLLVSKPTRIVSVEEQLSSVKLLKCFKNTRVKSSYILQKGMQKGYCEYLLEYV